LDGEEFEQLCAMVGMDKKPFHVMRLKKALSRHAATAKPHLPLESKSKPPASATAPLSVSSPALATTGQSASSGYSLNAEQNHRSVDAIAKKLTLQPSVSVVGMSSSATQSSGGVKQTAEGGKPKTFLPPYLQEDSEGLNFEELVDDQTPVQKTLGPSPFQPGMWDSGRKELVRKYATIYGKNFNRRQKELLTPFEEQVNEGAYQLCLRDPTLLVRREELFLLSKRAVKEGGYTYYHGFPKSKEIDSTIATTGQKRPRPRSGSARFDAPPNKMLITSDLAEEVPKKMSGRMRQERMLELERMIAANKTQQEAKLVELEQAQQLCNFSAAFSIQLEVESLGNACQTLQTSYAAIKRKQRRSDRYYSMKEREGDDPERERSPTDSIPAQTTQSGKRTGVTATIIPTTTQCPGAQVKQPSNFDDSPPEGEDSEVQDLVKNVSHATDEVNSLMIREFQKQLAWDL
jgi:hypothetical protein